MIKNITYKKLRKLWFDFFISNNHFKLDSVPLIPMNDKSLLWINSGIAGLKQYFIEDAKPPSNVLTNIQMCMRTNDIENVGITLRHHTFFEMMGFFSIGEYFKETAIKLSWDFLTSDKWLGIDKNKLFITVYEKDLDTKKIWLDVIGISKKHLILCKKKHNFWEIGVGPCGPNTEIYYDWGEENDSENKGIELLKGDIENNRYLEIWNIVFSELYSEGDNTYTTLPKKNIDTGVGLERLLSVLENKVSTYDTSIFDSVKSLIINSSNKSLSELNSKRNIILIRKLCDFSRSITFILGAGISLDNKGRGYTLKSLIKLSSYISLKLQIEKLILKKLLLEFISFYKDSYPILNNINDDLVKICINYEKDCRKSNSYILDIEKNKNIINSYKHSSDVFKELYILEYWRKIYKRIEKYYIPYNRFKQLETYGRWSFENKDLFKEYFDLLNINYYNSYRYSVLMPPPNITGKLHLGHAYELYIQDTIIKENHFLGKDTLWLPGLDHAGIATQSILEKYIKNDKKIDRYKLSKKEFYEIGNEWKNKYEKEILYQWDVLGVIPNNQFISYSMSSTASLHVNWAFKKLYNDKLILKKRRIINWDFSLKTAISDIEIEYKNTNMILYYIKYFIKGTNDYLVVATSRPETIFADVCLFVNNNDDKYKKYVGMSAINPLNNNILPIMQDKYVDPSFGTGVLKCTPAHDVNDYKLGKKYKLKNINCISNENKIIDTSMSEVNGMSVNDARKYVVNYLKNKNYLIKCDEYVGKAPYSQRSNTLVQPIMSTQWFIDTKKIAKIILKKWKNYDNYSKIIPSIYSKNFYKWVNNIDYWCISRQIAWGHPIPVWYSKINNDIISVGEKPKNYKDCYQDNDVLDTWFSSSLWPLITLNYLKKPDFFYEYFPITTLITGYDILFFWVTRMILLTSYLIKDDKKAINTNFYIFENILLHGLIRDKNNKKMSKSNKNGVDPVEIINKHGSETLRMFFLLNHSPGLDIKFNEDKIEENKSILIKLENIYKFLEINIKKYKIKNFNIIDDKLSYYAQYIITEFILFIKKLFTINYKFYSSQNSFINEELYKLSIKYFFNDFCSKYIEAIKTEIQIEQLEIEYKKNSVKLLIYIFSEILIILNPLIPFTTYDIFNKLNHKNIYNFNSLLAPKRFDQLISNCCINFNLNILFSIKPRWVYVYDNFNLSMHNIVWSLIKKYINENKLASFYIYCKNDINFNIMTKSFLISYFGAKNIFLSSNDIKFKENVLNNNLFQKISITFYSNILNEGFHIVFYSYFSDNFIKYLLKNLKIYKNSLNNEKNIINSKILKLKSVVGKIHSASKISKLRLEINNFNNKLEKIHSSLDLFNQFNKFIE